MVALVGLALAAGPLVGLSAGDHDDRKVVNCTLEKTTGENELVSFEYSPYVDAENDIHVGTVHTSDGGYIVLTDTDGSVAGRRNLTAGAKYPVLQVSLEESWEDGNYSTLTATIYQENGTPYPGNSTKTANVRDDSDVYYEPIGAFNSVEAMVFPDRVTRGDVVRIDRLRAEAGGFVVLTDEDGSVLGRRNLSEDVLHTGLEIPLDEPLSHGVHEVTATVCFQEGMPYTRSNSTESATIAVEPPRFEVTDVSPRNASAQTPDDPVKINATLAYNLDENVTMGVEFVVDGETRESLNLSLAGPEETRVAFTVPTADLEHGDTVEYEVRTANNSMNGLVSVASEADENPERGGGPDIGVADLSSETTDMVAPGDEFEITATVHNEGNETVTQTVEFEFDGASQDSETVTLAAGEQREITFSANTSGLESGSSVSYGVAVGNSSRTDSFTVADEPEDGKNGEDGGDGKNGEGSKDGQNGADGEDRGDDEVGENGAGGEDGSGAGFGIVIAVLAMVSMTLLVIRGRP